MKKWEKPMIQELELKNTAITTGKPQYICCTCQAQYNSSLPGTLDSGGNFQILTNGKCGNPDKPSSAVGNPHYCFGNIVPNVNGACS